MRPPTECLKRELQEEMQIAIEPFAYNDHRYGEKHIWLTCLMKEVQMILR